MTVMLGIWGPSRLLTEIKKEPLQTMDFESVAESLDESISDVYTEEENDFDQYSGDNDDDQYSEDFSDEQPVLLKTDLESSEENYSTDFNAEDQQYSEDFDIISPAIPELSTVLPPVPENESFGGKYSEIDMLKVQLEYKTKELDKIRQFRLNKLGQKKDRAKERRMNHMKQLTTANAECDAARQDKETMKEKMDEEKSKLIQAQARIAVLYGNADHMKNENNIAKEEIEVLKSQVTEVKFQYAKFELEQIQLVRSLKKQHENQVASLEKQFQDYRLHVENERGEFEQKCLKEVREHETRVDRLQASVETEMALLSTERDRHEKRKEEFQVKMHLINSRETQSIAEERERMTTMHLRAVNQAKVAQNMLDGKLSDVENVLARLRVEEEFVRNERQVIVSLRNQIQTKRDVLTTEKEQFHLLLEKNISRETTSEKYIQLLA